MMFGIIRHLLAWFRGRSYYLWAVIVVGILMTVAYGRLYDLTTSYTPLPPSLVSRSRWIELRNVTAADTAFTKTTRSWADIYNDPNYSSGLIDQTWRRVNVAFWGYADATDPNLGSFDASIYVVKPYSNPQLVAELYGKIGSMRLSHDPATGEELYDGAADPNSCWCDYLDPNNLGTSQWIGDVALSANAQADSSGDIATCNFNIFDNYAILVKVTNVNALDNVHVVVSGYGQ